MTEPHTPQDPRRHAETLLPEVYDELRKLAAARINRLSPGQTLQPTALVHEAYLRLINRGDPGWDNEAHFFGAAARAMRNILVDQARRKNAVRHGGDKLRIDFDDSLFVEAAKGRDLVDVDDALRRLEADDPRKGEVVTLRFFGGLTIDQTAQCLGVSNATVERDWNYARAWLHRELGREDTGASG